MRAKKVDNTQAEIVAALRAAGISVRSTATVGDGFPDLACAYRGFTALVECKTGRAKLKTGQEKFRRDWPGMVIVAYDGQQAKTEFICAWAMDRISKIKADKFDKIEASGSPTV